MVQDNDGEAERPLLTTQEEPEYGTTRADPTPKPGAFKRNLGAIEAFAIIISIVIGSGIFTSPGSIDANVPSPGAALLIWLVGGVLAWTGASTLAELGTAIPGEGLSCGVQPYLKHIFGDVFGFLAAWTWIVAVMPATLAILSIVFIESIFTARGVTDQAGSIEHKLLSVLVLIAINLANSISTKASTRLNNFFVATKFITILGVVVAGISVVIIATSNPKCDVGGGDWNSKPWFKYRDSVATDGSTIDWALYGALWAYSGWDKAIYISDELSSPARQLPLAINSAVPTIIICFIAANVAYYILLPWNLIAITDSVAVTAISRLLGPSWGILAAFLVCLVVAGALLGNSFVAGRMTVAAANMNWLPNSFFLVGQFTSSNPKSSPHHDTNSPPTPESSSGAETPKSDAPYNALLLSTILSALYILLGNFRALLTFNGLGEYTFFFLTVVGAIVLRVREPELRRPYKPIIIIPIVFAVVSGFVVVRGAIFAPLQAGVLILLWVVGGGFYWVRGWLRGREVEG